MQRLRWASKDKVILKKKEINSYLKGSRNHMAKNKRPRDVKETGGSENAAGLKSEDRRLKKIRGGYI